MTAPPAAGSHSEDALAPALSASPLNPASLYASDGGRGSIRKIDPSEIITTVASGLDNGAQIALFAGRLYFAEFDAGCVLQVSSAGVITTTAGVGLVNFSGDGGPGQAAALSLPYGVALDAAENLYIAELFNHRIRKLALDGRITTLAGNGRAGFSGDNGAAVNAALNNPMAVDAAGNLYIADSSKQPHSESHP